MKASCSSGDKDDRKQLQLMIKDMFGKIFRDRGYISQKLLQELLEQGVFMVTRVRNKYTK